jgi:tRNA A-37 threonylcarbamoyl transferase component Bud32
VTTTSKPRLDGFEFLELLGKGAFGEVWLAQDLTLGVQRAIKVVPRDRFRESEVQRLIAEGQKMARFPKHRNRVGVHFAKAGITNCFLVMEYVAGGALSKETHPEKPMPWVRATRYVAGVGDGLLEVHARGLVHRDIKPANILLDPEADEALLGDFGIATLEGLSPGPAGTEGYMAPELVNHTAPASAKSDVFSLAATLFHLVTGQKLSATHSPGDCAGWAQLPIELRSVILAGMESDPDRRSDLPTFLGVLREARGKELAERILRHPECQRCKVKLQVSVEVAKADAPTVFHPLASEGSIPLPVATGDLVKVEAAASANGYHTVLILGSSGELHVAFPRPAEPQNHFAAGQRHSLLLQLTPPAGTERILVLWSRKEVRRTPAEWSRRLENAKFGHTGPEEGSQETRVRGIEVVGSMAGPIPEGNWRAVVIPVPHRANANNPSG